MLTSSVYQKVEAEAAFMVPGIIRLVMHGPVTSLTVLRLHKGLSYCYPMRACA